ncbi:MAG: hypothetical protein JST54_12930 [Deltaproteobacteria bacterium]|nr:hypothetical protein [Deltaproteobacteria bacterium]
MRKALAMSLLGGLLGCTGGTVVPTISGSSSGGATPTTTGTTSTASTGSTGGSSGHSGSTASSSTGTTGTAGTTGTSGSTTGSTGSTGVYLGAGPWPTAQSTQFVTGEPMVDVSVDEAENIWAVSNDALYILRPGQTVFRKYTDADGLHIGNAGAPGIMNVAGGKANEGFVGYNGVDIPTTPQITGDPTQDAPLKMGGIDHISLKPDGTLTVTHLDIHSDDYVVGGQTDFSYYEDRGTRRMLYDHTFHPGTLYTGWNHGVNRIDWGTTDPTTKLPFADHVHPIVVSQTDAGTTEWMAEWRGLALDPTNDGALWMGGEFTGGAIKWTPALYTWTCQRADCNPSNDFLRAYAGAYGQPLFPVPADGSPMNVRGVAVTKDGTAWFVSGPQWNPGVDAVYGIAQVQGWTVNWLDPGAIGLPGNQLMDVVALPDGTLVFALLGGGLWHYDPKTKTTTAVPNAPADVNLMWVDPMVTPPALWVASDQGVTLLRF